MAMAKLLLKFGDNMSNLSQNQILFPDTKALTLSNVVEDYQTYLEASYSNKTSKEYSNRIRICWEVLNEIGIYDLHEVTRHHIHEWVLTFRQREWMGEVISANTVRQYCIALKNFITWLWQEEKISHNPIKNFKLPKRAERLKYKIPTRGEVYQLLQAPDTSTGIGARDSALFHLGYEGLRSEEARLIKISDLQLHKRQIKIIGKGNKEAIVSISKATVNAISNYLNNYRTNMILGLRSRGAPTYKSESALEEDYLFVTINGNRLNAQNLLDRIARYGRQLGWHKDDIPRFHALRGAMCTHIHKQMVEETGNYSLVSIQRICRHASMQTTLDYIHSDQSDIEKTHEKFHPLSQGIKGFLDE